MQLPREHQATMQRQGDMLMQLQQAQQAGGPNHVESNAGRLDKIVRSETASKKAFDVLPKVLKDLLGVKARDLEDN